MGRSTCGAIATAFAIAVVLSSPPAAAESVLDQIQARGELRVAGVLYRPLISQRPNGMWVGMDVEVMKRMADDLGVTLNIVNSEWATAVAGIESGKWDIVPALCITDARLEVVDFSESYITIGATLTVASDNEKELNTPEDFNRPDVTFAVPGGSWSESVAREVAPNATLKVFGQSTSADLIQEVITGRADAVVLDTPIQTTVALDSFGDRIRVIPGHNQPLDVRACNVGYAYMKGDEKMGEYMSQFTETLRDSGELAALVEEFMTAEQISAAE